MVTLKRMRSIDAGGSQRWGGGQVGQYPRDGIGCGRERSGRDPAAGLLRNLAGRKSARGRGHINLEALIPRVFEEAGERKTPRGGVSSVAALRRGNLLLLSAQVWFMLGYIGVSGLELCWLVLRRARGVGGVGGGSPIQPGLIGPIFKGL